MIEAQEAVRRATEEIEQLYPESTLRDLLLEEIELEDSPMNVDPNDLGSIKRPAWLVTMGFTRPTPRVDRPIQALTLPPRERAYKRVKIDSETGAFRGMSDRLLDEQHN